MTSLHEKLAECVRGCRRSVAAELADGILELVLDAPARLNALNGEMLTALAGLLDTAAAHQDVRVVIITGRGRAFSSGQDLSEVRIDIEDRTKLAPSDLLQQYYNPLIRRIRGVDLPMIAAVNGVAAGGSASIALACDFVVAAKSAYFAQGFTKIALMPDCGATWFLPRLVGDVRARAMLYLDEKVDATTAERIGMIHSCVGEDQVLPEARKIATTLARMPRYLVGSLKRALRESSQHSLAVQLELEESYQREAERNPAFRDGVVAFLERRTPEFE